VAVSTLALAAFVSDVWLGQAVPPRIPLHDVPFHIGTWTGRVEQVDPELIRRAHPDEVLNRRYVDEHGRIVLAYVGYYGRQSTRGQVLAACQAECEVLATDVQRINVPDGPIEVNRAGVREDGSLMAVLYWFQQGVGVTPDPVRSKLEQVERSVLHRRSNGAVVRITAPVATTEDEAWQRAEAFAKVFMPVLRSHLSE
jgi:EpsI family protein